MSEPQSSFAGTMQHAAGKAAMVIAASYDLKVHNPVLIGGYSNTLFKLEPLPLVARVATATATVRQDAEWMGRELALASYLVETGVSGVRPSQLLPPGPHKQDGLNITFWEYFEHSGISPTPRRAGELLRNLHDALIEYPSSLPALGPLQETWKILDRPELTHSLHSVPRAIVVGTAKIVQQQLDQYMLELRPLHGDAHHGNLWQSPDGPIWGDFEDTCTGPVEWDLACLVTSSSVLGTGRAAAEALQGYGNDFDPELLDLFMVARTVQAVAWAFVSLSEPTLNMRLQNRLKWLERQH